MLSALPLLPPRNRKPDNRHRAPRSESGFLPSENAAVWSPEVLLSAFLRLSAQTHAPSSPISFCSRATHATLQRVQSRYAGLSRFVPFLIYSNNKQVVYFATNLLSGISFYLNSRKRDQLYRIPVVFVHSSFHIHIRMEESIHKNTESTNSRPYMFRSVGFEGTI